MQLRFLLLILPLISAAGEPGRVSVLTYNLQNLFDTQDDPERRDETFLPLARKQSEAHRRQCEALERKKWQRQCLRLNWDDKALQGKVEALAAVIGQAGGADVLVLQEVENSRVLHQLADALATDDSAQAYRHRVLIEARDPRGIDQAVISRLPLAGQPRLHNPGALRPRGVLQVPLRLPGGKVLQVYAVHLPAAYHPVRKRLKALRSLGSLVRPGRGNRLLLLAGDFNLTPEDRQHPGVVRELDRWVEASTFCHQLCQGTHYYGRERRWAWLDNLLLPPHMAPDGAACWRLEDGSVQVVTDAPEQLTPGGYPRSYSVHSGRGASDHLPVVLSLQNHC